MVFHWLETDAIGATEHGWLNAHRIATGALPVLNKLDSPVTS